LDYAVFSVEPYDWDISWLDVGSGAGAVVGERVTVYGHPAGGLLRKSGRSASEIVDVGRGGTLRYRADATGGASGGPVLSTKTGELLAVHLGGDPQREANRGLLISTILQEWQP
jgi:V8-like Glu-specific endopeptidase